MTPWLGLGTIGSTTRALGTSLAGVAVSHARIFVEFDTKLAFPTGSPAGGKVGYSTSRQLKDQTLALTEAFTDFCLKGVTPPCFPPKDSTLRFFG